MIRILVLRYLAQRLAAPVVLRLPTLEEATLAIFIHVLLFLGGIELLRGDLFSAALVRNDSFLDLFSCAALARQEGIWKMRVRGCYTAVPHSPILKACQEPTTPLCRVSTTWKTSDFLKLISPLSVWS